MPLIAGENSRPLPLSSGGSTPSNKEGGGGSSKPCDKGVRGGLVPPKIVSSSLRTSVWSKHLGRGGPAPPLDPSLLSDSPDDVN